MIDNDLKKGMSTSALAIKTGYSILDWPQKCILTLVNIIFRNVDPKMKEKIVDVFIYADSNEKKKIKAQKWMEAMYEKNMDITPTQMAYRYMYYAKIKRKMKPFYLVIAQRTKKLMRDRHRIRRIREAT
jgi:hypothetical protein